MVAANKFSIKSQKMQMKHLLVIVKKKVTKRNRKDFLLNGSRLRCKVRFDKMPREQKI